MEKKFKIIMPPIDVTPEIVNQRVKKLFSDDVEFQEGILAKVFIFIYQHQPISISDLTKKINEHYQVDYDRTLIFRAVDKLANKNLVCIATSGDVLSLSPIDQKPIHKQIIEQYHNFLLKIPAQFRNRFQIVNYVWMSDKQRLDYLEWCCKLLNFKFEEE
jgi:hypothetical protein